MIRGIFFVEEPGKDLQKSPLSVSTVSRGRRVGAFGEVGAVPTGHCRMSI
jgi:hypothetical protein